MLQAIDTAAGIRSFQNLLKDCQLKTFYFKRFKNSQRYQSLLLLFDTFLEEYSADNSV